LVVLRKCGLCVEEKRKGDARRKMKKSDSRGMHKGTARDNKWGTE